jgi:hypothetical protein
LAESHNKLQEHNTQLMRENDQLKALIDSGSLPQFGPAPFHKRIISEAVYSSPGGRASGLLEDQTYWKQKFETVSRELEFEREKNSSRKRYGEDQTYKSGIIEDVDIQHASVKKLGKEFL